MNAQQVKDLLHKQIPLAAAMDMEVVTLTPDLVELTAPLTPNGNHMGTAFGGSICTLMILACYTWMFNRLGVAGEDCHVLIKNAHTDYLKPVTGQLRARCEFNDQEEVDRMLEHYKRKGVARLVLQSTMVDESGKILCRFQGEFVAKCP